MRFSLRAIVLAALFGLLATAPAQPQQQPVQWRYTFDNTGTAQALYPGNVVVDGTLSGPNVGCTVFPCISPIDSIESIGIGTNALASQNAAGVAAYGNIAIGFDAMGLGTLTTSAFNNTAVGTFALSQNTSGTNLTAFGYSALRNNTTGGNSVAVGWNADLQETTGVQNDAFGHDALNCNTTGGANVAMGEGAAFGNGSSCTPSDIVALGANSMFDVSTAQQDVASGENSLSACTSCSNDVVEGYNSAVALVTGNNNVLIGSAVAPTSNGGSQNVVIGQAADVHDAGTGQAVILGTGAKGAAGDVMLGFEAGNQGGSGFSETFLGFEAGLKVTGANNTIIGASVASTTLVGGNHNIIIGVASNCDASGASASQEFDLCAGSGSTPLLRGNLTSGSLALTDNGSMTVTPLTGCTGIQTNGSGLMSCVPSDRRLKDDLGVVVAGIGDIPALHAFTYKKDYGPPGTRYGWFAQDVQFSHPELVRLGPKTKLTPKGELLFDRVDLLTLIVARQQHEIADLQKQLQVHSH